jgi:RimK family alpha-L-glutamate ligase
VTVRLRVGVLGASGSWHTRGLIGALTARGHEVLAIPATRLQSEVDQHGDVHVLGPEGAMLDALDLLVVRGLPRGSLEQVIFRMDALHVLAEHGVRCVNSPRAIERTVDKSWAGAVLARAGVPTPPTIVCERYDGAMRAFEQLGGDVVVKPLFGAMGNGIVRLEDRDLAHRTFRALELERAVYYVQRTIAPAGRRNLRVLVVGGEIAGAMERVTDSWRANVARGARPRAVALTEDERRVTLAAAGALEADVAGVDLLVAPDDDVVVLEVNGIPGWQALQSVGDQDLTQLVVSACEALASRA